jgi:hypothetical protein
MMLKSYDVNVMFAGRLQLLLPAEQSGLDVLAPPAPPSGSPQALAVLVEFLGWLIEVTPAAVCRLAGDADLFGDVGPRLAEGTRLEHALLQDLLSELENLCCDPHRFKAVLRLLLSREPATQGLAQRRSSSDVASRVTVR